jgi:hypothetical protein
MSQQRDKFETQMDALAARVLEVEARLLDLNGEPAHGVTWYLRSRAVAASYHLDLARQALARPPGSGSGGSTGQHDPDPIGGGGLKA